MQISEEMSAEHILEWLKSDILDIGGATISTINSPSVDTTNDTPRIQFSILRNAVIGQSPSLVIGLADTLNALHSAAKNGLNTCIIVVREESAQPESKCRVSESLKALRQLGLFAMEYGGVFVGSVRFNSTPPEEEPNVNLDEDSTEATRRVINEALQFQGLFFTSFNRMFDSRFIHFIYVFSFLSPLP